MKILTLNIWRYFGDWSQRKPEIIRAIKQENPDILFLQEVFDDERHQPVGGPHQGEQLQQELGFTHAEHTLAERITREHKQAVTANVFDYLTCMTNLPIVSAQRVPLTRDPKDTHDRALQVISVSYKGQEVLFYHTHLSNKDSLSRMQLEEIKTYSISRAERPIILGDLNILHPTVISETLSDIGYVCSYDASPYISFPSKHEVLDYVVLPKERYCFKSVRCEYDNCSDHRALIVDVERIQ